MYETPLFTPCLHSRRAHQVRALYEMECAEAEKAAAREKSLGSVDARTGKAYDDMGWEVQQPEKDAARRPKTQGTRPSKIKFAEVYSPQGIAGGKTVAQLGSVPWAGVGLDDNGSPRRHAVGLRQTQQAR